MATVKKVKKAQLGAILDNYKQKEKGNTTKIKGTDPSGRYNIKVKSTSNDDGTITSVGKTRRTLKGFLSGAPRVEKQTTVTKAKDGKWMQKAAASIKRRGTEGVCTGSKFGGPTCKPGSKRYNLAKTFKAIGKARKKK